eukprot:TRINITY_DN4935_c0_g2_i2.p1 TRINITY_DN4935_c0_g2~~TRINITY_DN4935_c0_g2_i2.p1  ORF type:complete len:100 (-),score=17.83 TRINITY_DN4935_c0_g2_i2:301-600(-)
MIAMAQQTLDYFYMSLSSTEPGQFGQIHQLRLLPRKSEQFLNQRHATETQESFDDFFKRDILEDTRKLQQTLNNSKLPSCDCDLKRKAILGGWVNSFLE